MRSTLLRFFLFSLFISALPGAFLYGGRIESLNFGWKFSEGAFEGAPEINFDDSEWKQISIPHDWAISGPFDSLGEGATGKLPWRGEAWYRKRFELSRADSGKAIYLMFDGVMAFPEVYVNGLFAGKWDYGYNTFYLEVTELVRFGVTNVLAVHVDTRSHGSRWYPGAGIYRKVTMIVKNPVHVSIWGTYISSPEVRDTWADLRAIATLRNTGAREQAIRLETSIVSPGGGTVAARDSTLALRPGEEREVEQWFTVTGPRRWDIANPVRYTLLTLVRTPEGVVDSVRTPFGIRTFAFSADNGFLLNGRRVQLKGVNLHHDHGPLGAAFNARAMERQLEILREMGCNAIRNSHNVCAPELPELCDRMGFLLFNEAFDKWDDKADITPETDFYEFAERNIRNFIVRDRNHPCVILWSVGNEIGDIQQNREGGLRKLQAMVAAVRRHDPTRPVTMVCDDVTSVKWRHFDYYDVHCWNYGRRYAAARRLEPKKAVIISESASTVSTRGFYELPLPEVKTDFTKSLQVSSTIYTHRGGRK